LKIMGMLRRSPQMPPAVKAWALAEEWMVEPRGPEAVIEIEETGEAEQAAKTIEVAEEPQPDPPPVNRLIGWRRRRA
jgi:hypothetical protein